MMNTEKDRYNELVAEKARLQSELEVAKKALGSRRMKIANRIADVCRFFVPIGSKRDACAMFLLRNIMTGRRYMRNKKAIGRAASFVKKKRKIIIICGTPFSTALKQRSHHMAELLSDSGETIIYYEPMETVRGTRAVSQNLLITNNWTVISEIIKKRKNIYFIFSNVFSIPVDSLRWLVGQDVKIVYELIDDLNAELSDGLTNQLQVWRELPKMSPYLIVATAKKLYDKAERHFSGSRVILNRNAVSLADFSRSKALAGKCPADMEKIMRLGRPVVGFCGALASWIDFDLVEKIANDGRFEVVLIGANYNGAMKELNFELEHLHYLGLKKYLDVYKYMARFDAAIIPFRDDIIAENTSPLKLYEYMAMGVPVVATENLVECGGYEYVSVSSERLFLKNIEDAVFKLNNDKVRKKLFEYAKENSWQQRIEELKRFLR